VRVKVWAALDGRDQVTHLREHRDNDLDTQRVLEWKCPRTIVAFKASIYPCIHDQALLNDVVKQRELSNVQRCLSYDCC